MFLGLIVRETYVAETNFAAQRHLKVFASVENIFVSRTQILLSKDMFRNFATSAPH